MGFGESREVRPWDKHLLRSGPELLEPWAAAACSNPGLVVPLCVPLEHEEKAQELAQGNGQCR